MKLHKVFNKGTIVPQQYVTTDRRYFVNKSPHGWNVYHIEPDSRYKFFKEVKTLKEVRDLL